MKKILLYLIAILTPFVFISGVNGATLLDITNYFQAQQLHIDNCESSTSCDIGMTEVNYGDYYSSPQVKLGTAGVYIRFVSNTGFKRNQIYSIQNIICFDGSTSLNPTFKLYPSRWKFVDSVWERQYVNSIGTDLSRDGVYTDDSFDMCRSVITMFSPNENSNEIGIHITNPTAVSNITIHHIGYFIESLGVFDQAIDTKIEAALDNSGLATATSVEEVESSINIMKSEITSAQQETNDKLEEQMQQNQQQHQETMDTLTNSDAPDDMDSLSSASGWLPPGPVDSLLTLPLSMLNNISTSLGSSCTPINLPIPFVDKNLTMPCLNTIYSQISGLGVFLNSIGTIAAGFMLYYYFKKLYAYIDNLLSLKNNGEGWGDV